MGKSSEQIDFTDLLLSVIAMQETLDQSYQKLLADPRVRDDNTQVPNSIFQDAEISIIMPDDVLASLSSSITINWNRGDPIPDDMPLTGAVYGYDTVGNLTVTAAWWHSPKGWRSILYTGRSSQVENYEKNDAVYAPYHGMQYIMEFLKLTEHPEFGFTREVRGDILCIQYQLPKAVNNLELEKLPEFHLQPKVLPTYTKAIRKKRSIGRTVEDSIWWVAEDLSSVVWDAVLSGTAPTDILEEALPSYFGIMYFDGGEGLPLPCVPLYGPEAGTIQYLTINAVIWDQSFDRNELLINGKPSRVNFTPVAALSGPFLSYPDTNPATLPLMTDSIGSPDWSIEHVLGFSRKSVADLSEKLVKTALRLSRMEYFAKNQETIVEPPTKSARKKAAREKSKPDTVVIATLRKPKKQPNEELIDSHGREYSHRWIVRGHNRKQLIGKRDSEELVYKTVWIAPYVKGPWEKPLVIKDKVNVWKR